MPAILVELGFLSNPDEEKKLQDPEYRAQLVEALVKAISRYKDVTEARELPAAAPGAGPAPAPGAPPAIGVPGGPGAWSGDAAARPGHGAPGGRKAAPVSRRAAAFTLAFFLAVLAGGAAVWYFAGHGRPLRHLGPRLVETGGEHVALLADLYFPADGANLKAERRELAVTRAPREQIRKVVEALLAGPTTTSLARPLPKEVTLGSVLLSDSRRARRVRRPPVGEPRSAAGRRLGRRAADGLQRRRFDRLERAAGAARRAAVERRPAADLLRPPGHQPAVVADPLIH